MSQFLRQEGKGEGAPVALITCAPRPALVGAGNTGAELLLRFTHDTSIVRASIRSPTLL
ncbi:MAG TPA: hypothetical protein VFV38_04135 [Ktedonobacteraceae bacterium]|nr:hypothetical protein [Ktedonobacteraceae bacterium]